MSAPVARRHLRSVSCDGVAYPMTPRPVTPQSLSVKVVAAAQAWAAVALASPLELDEGTEEGRRRLALLDAVHDLEYHSAGAAVIYLPPSLPLLFGEPGPDAS